jgi:hypothetical protein
MNLDWLYQSFSFFTLQGKDQIPWYGYYRILPVRAALIAAGKAPMSVRFQA